MEQPRESHLERQSNYTNFMLHLLDRRHEIEQSLHKQESDGLREDFTCSGFRAENFEPPEFLDSYLEPFSSVTIDVAATIDTNGQISFDNMQLYPEDRAPLSIERDENFTIVRQGGEVASMLFDTESIETTLRQLLPPNVRSLATSSQILHYIDEYSPAITNTAELNIQTATLTGTVAFSKIETIDDSIETLSVVNRLPHPSHQDVLVRLALTESINRRRLEKNTNQTSRNLTIEVAHAKTSEAGEWSIEELVNAELHKNATIAIDTATRQHINRITEVLSELPK